jgi:hypothetical protein
MLDRRATEQPTPAGIRRHHFMDRSIDLPADLTEVQLDCRACVRCGAEDQPMRPGEGSSAISSQLFVCADTEVCCERCDGRPEDGPE